MDDKPPSEEAVKERGSEPPAPPPPPPKPVMPPPPPPRKRKTPCIGGCYQKPPPPRLGKEELRDPDFGRMLAAEFIGTCFMVFFGVLSIITSAEKTNFPVSICGGIQNPIPPGCARKYPNGQRVLDGPHWYIDPDGTNYTIWYFVGKPNPLHISLAFGIAVATLVQALGHISGAHFNPSVTLGVMVLGKIGFLKALCYIVFQFLGAIMGITFVWLGTHNMRVEDLEYKPNGQIPKFIYRVPNWGMGATVLQDGTNAVMEGIATEFMITFILVFTVCSLYDDLRKDIKGSAPLAIGLAVFLGHAAALGYTGASMNIARTFASAILSSDKKAWPDIWVYFVAHLFAGMEGGFTYTCFFRQKPQEPEPQPQQPMMMMGPPPPPGGPRRSGSGP